MFFAVPAADAARLLVAAVAPLLPVAFFVVAVDARLTVGGITGKIDFEAQVGTFGIGGAACPATVATNSATSTACWPTTTFWGMIAPEKPPFWIAYRTRAAGRSQRTLKLGPLFSCAVRMLDADPFVAAFESVWQPAQRWLNSTAPWCSTAYGTGWFLGTLMRCVPHAAARAQNATMTGVTRRTLAGRLMRAGIIRNNRPPMTRPAAQLGVVIVLCASLIGCGRTELVGANRVVRVALTEYRMNPERIKASAGQLTFLVHNYGRLTHDLAVSHNGKPVGSTPPLAPGRASSLTITLAKGNYLMDSTILSDQDLGIYGSLIVR